MKIDRKLSASRNLFLPYPDSKSHYNTQVPIENRISKWGNCESVFDFKIQEDQGDSPTLHLSEYEN